MKKKLLINCVMLLFAFQCFSQSAEKTAYLKKSRNQQITAWVLLGGGIGVSVIGLTQINVAGSDNGSVNNTPGTVLLATGLAASLTSIPLFIASQKNKKRAVSVSFKHEKMQQLINSGYVTKHVPSLNLSIGL
jgi:hypothetical protein